MLRAIGYSGIYLYLAGRRRQKDCREFKASQGYMALGQPGLQSQTLLQKSKESSIAVDPVQCKANLPDEADSPVHSGVPIVEETESFLTGCDVLSAEGLPA